MRTEPELTVSLSARHLSRCSIVCVCVCICGSLWHVLQHHVYGCDGSIQNLHRMSGRFFRGSCMRGRDFFPDFSLAFAQGTVAMKPLCKWNKCFHLTAIVNAFNSIHCFAPSIIFFINKCTNTHKICQYRE